MIAITTKQRQMIAALYKDLGFDARRQAAFNRRACGQDDPRTVAEAIKVLEGQKAFALRLYKPYQRTINVLLKTLYVNRGEMTPWERDTFLPDIVTRVRQGEGLTPNMIKKIRQIAHKYDVPCGFPPLRDLAASKMSEVANG